MQNVFGRLKLVSLAIAAGLLLLPRSASAQCGNCDPGRLPIEDRASSGSYKFAAGVSEGFQQSTFWADDGWGVLGHDQNDPEAITISTYSDSSSPFTGEWDPDNNTISVNLGHSIFNGCNDNCNVLISVLAHEMGHALGFANIEGGCESSIMSWDRDRNQVLGPSSEDLCWYWYQGEGGGEGGGCQPYCLDVLRNSDNRTAAGYEGELAFWRSLPDGWKQMVGRSSLAVVLNLTRVVQVDQETQLAASVAKIIGGREVHSVGSEADVDLRRSMVELAGMVSFSDLTVGSTYLAFLTRDGLIDSFALSRRPVLLRR